MRCNVTFGIDMMLQLLTYIISTHTHSYITYTKYKTCYFLNIKEWQWSVDPKI